jgi:hypothetical protein
MPEEWNSALYCPLHQKADKTLCSSYRAIELLDVLCKVFSKIVSKRMEACMEVIVGNYQAGFRANISTTVEIFTMKQI